MTTQQISIWLIVATFLAFLTESICAHKLLLINDVHLDIDSTAYYSEPGTETNIRTLDLVLQEAAKIEDASGEPLEAILLIGDLCKHHLAVDEGTPLDQTNWEIMKQTMIEVITSIKTAFPTVPILPVIGNNDVVYHDQAPNDAIKSMYYDDLWEIWFQNVTANAELAANATIKQTWDEGGYYVVELGQDTMILCLNGMYPFYENHEGIEPTNMANQMIDWVQTTLEANPDKKFITQTHVFFGNNYFEELEVLWNKTYTDKLMQVMQPHQDNLIISLGAHIHHVQLMAPESSAVTDLNVVQVINPAISPIYNNNPGYGVLIFNADDGVESLVFRFFQLEDFQRLGLIDFNHYDFMHYTGVDLNDASSVRDYIDSLFYNMQLYAGYIARNYGLKEFLAEGSQLWWPFISQMYSSQRTQVATVCSLKYFDTDLFPEYCREACGLNES